MNGSTARSLPSIIRHYCPVGVGLVKSDADGHIVIASESMLQWNAVLVMKTAVVKPILIDIVAAGDSS